jgi:hypothetical protein
LCFQIQSSLTSSKAIHELLFAAADAPLTPPPPRDIGNEDSNSSICLQHAPSINDDGDDDEKFPWPSKSVVSAAAAAAVAAASSSSPAKNKIADHAKKRTVSAGGLSPDVVDEPPKTPRRRVFSSDARATIRHVMKKEINQRSVSLASVKSAFSRNRSAFDKLRSATAGLSDEELYKKIRESARAIYRQPDN